MAINENLIPKKKISPLDDKRMCMYVRANIPVVTVCTRPQSRPWQRSRIPIQESNLILKNSEEGTQEASIFEAPPFKMHYAGRQPTMVYRRG